MNKTLLILFIMLLIISGCVSKTGVEKPTTKRWDTAANRNVGIHDPSIFKDTKAEGSVYYAFGTHISQAKSEDLTNWDVPKRNNGYVNMADNIIYGDTLVNLEETFKWAGFNDADSKNGYNLWAPDVIYNEFYEWGDGTKGAYMYYYSASSTWRRSAIGFMVSVDVEGPYTYGETIVYSGFTKEDATDGSDRNINYKNTHIPDLIKSEQISGFNEKWSRKLGKEYNTDYAPNALDPTLIQNSDGSLYMVYGSWSGGIFLLELDAAKGTPIYPGEDSKTVDGRIVDRYFGTKLAGGFHKSGEGSYIIYSPESEYYYLYLTYGGLAADGGYNMRMFRSKDIDGPYVDAKGHRPIFTQADNNDHYGIKIMGNYKLDGMSHGYKASGHNSILSEDNKMFNVFHTRFENKGEAFELKVHEMKMSVDGWPVTLPYEYNANLVVPQVLKSSEVIGTYEIVNHQTNTTSNMAVVESLILHDNGTVSGDYNGTYEINEANQITIVTNDVEYKGIVTVQAINKNTEKIVLSVIGNNNESIYGSRGDR